MSALVISEIFRLFVNTLNPDDKYSRRNIQISENNFKHFCLKKRRLFVNFRLHFCNVQET